MTSRDLDAAQAASIEIGVDGRWNGRALLECLSAYGSFLVQHDRERWVVHAQVPGRHGEDIECALTAVEDCLHERGIEEVLIRIDGKPRRIAATAGSLS